MHINQQDASLNNGEVRRTSELTKEVAEAWAEVGRPAKLSRFSSMKQALSRLVSRPDVRLSQDDGCEKI